ncbi:hypothetical protein [Streptomyces sp. MP131-18]|uniref:hypothetical protein n=1 Tax=Streptomyces sp. MP131-18 TaxID=1857892 RepID=UPI00097CAB7A|nr:hypothetical protein [Streptomyces sp. MP131-18]ONK11972.1 hypothetical protein STBA_27080 [Streptomyces sp. MP131-18]
MVLTEAAHLHLAVAGNALRDLEAELAARLAGRADAGRLRRDLTLVIRDLGGETPPPLRPVW